MGRAQRTRRTLPAQRPGGPSRPGRHRPGGLFGLLAGLVGLLGIAAAGPARAGDVEVGAPAPPFELLGSDGKTYTLSQFAGEEAVVLAWFPKAFTPG